MCVCVVGEDAQRLLSVTFCPQKQITMSLKALEALGEFIVVALPNLGAPTA